MSNLYANENRIPIIPLKLYPDEWPPAPQDSDGGWACRAQNKFVFKQGLVYLWTAWASPRRYASRRQRPPQGGEGLRLTPDMVT